VGAERNVNSDEEGGAYEVRVGFAMGAKSTSGATMDCEKSVAAGVTGGQSVATPGTSAFSGRAGIIGSHSNDSSARS
jgi:hypothetical protein